MLHFVCDCVRYFENILRFLNVNTNEKEYDGDGYHYEAFDEKLEGGGLKVSANLYRTASFLIYLYPTAKFFNLRLIEANISQHGFQHAVRAILWRK